MKPTFTNEAGTGVTAVRCEYVLQSLRREWRVETRGTESSQLAGSQRGHCPPGCPDEAQHPSPGGTIVSKGISAGQGNNSYRGQVKVLPRASGARNYTQCDSMLIGNRCGAHTFPYIDVQNSTASVEHEASTSKIGEDQIFYCKQRGLNTENAISMIVNGFCKEVFLNLPTEFAVEAQKLLGVSLEGSVG